MKRILVPIVLLVLLVSAYLMYDHHVEHLPTGHRAARTLVLGHGGMGFHGSHPINSLSGFQALIALRADGSELDIRMTRDTQLVAYHDREVEACGDKGIEELTLEELRRCLSEESAPTLDEIIALPWPSGSVLSLDLKSEALSPDQQMIFAQRMVSFQTEKNNPTIWFESTSFSLLRTLKERGATHLYLYTAQVEEAIENAPQLGLTGLSIRNDLISAKDIRQAQAAGLQVMVWGISNRWEQRNALLRAPDIIQSDNPAHLLRLTRKQ